MAYSISRILLPVLFAGLMEAQNGTLTGTLSGEANSPDIVIVLTNTGTNTPQRITVRPDGSFSVSLPPGTYRVQVERGGRLQAEARELQIQAGANAPMTLQVSVGPVSETLEIEAKAPAAQDDPPEIGRSYDSRFIRSLPIIDRNSSELNGLMAGVSPPVIAFSRTQDPERTRTYNTNGLAAFANDNTVDGISIREPFTGVMSVHIVPVEGSKELAVRTSNYSADYGFASGAITNIFTRPGTNGLHGSLFGFYTNDSWQTRNALQPAGFADPRLRYWQYGATAGGALVPDTVFLFGSYQGTRDHGNSLQFGNVPTAAFAAGNFSAAGTPIYNPNTGALGGTGRTAFANGTIPTASINRISAAFLRNLPAANITGGGNNFGANVPYSVNNEVGDLKLDWRFTDATTGFMRYGISYANAAEGSLFGSVVGGPTASGLRNHHGSASIVGNYYGIIAEFRVGYSRYRNVITDASTGAFAQQLAGQNFGNGSGLPAVTISGLGTLGTSAGLPAKDINNNLEGAAAFNILRGRHQIRFGLDIRREQALGFQNILFGQYGINGGFFFGPGPTSLAGSSSVGSNVLASSLASFLLGAPTTAGVFNPAVTPSFGRMLYAGYVTDTIRLTPRLAIDVGLRYDVIGPVRTARDQAALIFNPSTNSTTVGNNAGSEDYDTNNLAPRIGAAFRMTERTVFRAGYAINYFPLPFVYSGLNTLGTGAIQGVTGSFQGTTFAIPNVPAASSTTAQNIALSTRNSFITPFTHNYYMMIQQELPAGFLFDIGYVGNNGRQLPYQLAANAAQPGTGLAGLPFFAAGRTAPVTEFGSGLTSNYNSGQVNITKRLSKGASFAVAYTYSKALDYGLAAVNNFNRAANYGPADWDRTHSLSISHLFALPVGVGSPRFNRGFIGQILANWEAVGYFRWATGTPINIVADPITCACPGNSSIQGNIASTGGSAFGSDFFSGGAPNSFGTIGRNALRGDDYMNYNASLFKSFAVRDNYKVELRGEAFNLLNNFSGANAPSNVSLPTFGQTSAALNGFGGRLFRVGVRVLF